jgi:hypothetical protein
MLGSNTVRLLVGILGFLSLIVGLAGTALMARAIALGMPATGAVGQLWYEADRASLNLLQVVLERHIWPPLWQDVVFPVLTQPAPLVAGIAVMLGAVLLLLSRRRRGPAGNGKRRLFSR